MKVIIALFATILFIATSFGSYSYGRESKSVIILTEMDCEKSCCKKINQQQPSSQEDNKNACCNTCSPLSSCNYYIILNLSESLIFSDFEVVKPRLDTQHYILNKFINNVFQPPEVNLFVTIMKN